MLENLTVDQLKEKAKGLGIAGVSSMNKAALVSAISAHESAPKHESEKQVLPVGMAGHKKFDKFKKQGA